MCAYARSTIYPDKKNVRVKNVRTVNAVRTYFRNEKMANYGITSIDDPCLSTDSAVDVVREPLAEVRVDFLCLLRCGNSTCANGPYWLVGYHHFTPVLDMICNRVVAIFHKKNLKYCRA